MCLLPFVYNMIQDLLIQKEFKQLILQIRCTKLVAQVCIYHSILE